MKKRMLSLMLAVLMVVCLLPTTALAATLVWPVPGHKSLSQGFYYNNANQYHYGIDISDGSITGATIVAAMGGTVKYVRNCTQHHPGSQHNCYGFGTGVVIIGDDGRAYQYAHMQGGSVPSNVYVGARVEAGQMIGRVGQTGDATGPHLHFGISNGQNYWENNVNPMLETYADGPSVGVEWINEKIQTWDTNCYVYSRATTSVKGTFSSGGITLWDSKGNVVATRDDSVNWTGTYLNVGYNITEEIGVTLTPGTAYKYQLRAVFNGKTYTKEGTVTTTGQAPHTHYYTATVTAPTCTAKGYTTHTCACGNSYVDTYTDALGHAWDNGKVTKQPTEAETGVKTFTCTHCGETKTETIPKLAHEHSYKAVVTAPTCTEKGYTTHTCACGDSYVDTYVDALGHAWDNGKVTKQPTEAETGVKTYICARCGETKTEVIPAGGCPSAGFTDVPGEDNWAHAGIDYCVANGLMSGVGGNLFAPKKTTTRAQIVQILYNLQGEPRVYGSTPFTDLTNDWYKDAILWAYQTGVVAGTSGTTFDPDLPVTREQIAVILMEYTSRVLGLKDLCTPADLSRYPDAGSVSDWAKNAMADAVALGLISGASNGGQTCLEPQGSATREQVATILMEFCKNVKK